MKHLFSTMLVLTLVGCGSTMRRHDDFQNQPRLVVYPEAQKATALGEFEIVLRVKALYGLVILNRELERDKDFFIEAQTQSGSRWVMKDVLGGAPQLMSTRLKGSCSPGDGLNTVIMLPRDAECRLVFFEIIPNLVQGIYRVQINRLNADTTVEMRAGQEGFVTAYAHIGERKTQ